MQNKLFQKNDKLYVLKRDCGCITMTFCIRCWYEYGSRSGMLTLDHSYCLTNRDNFFDDNACFPSYEKFPAILPIY